MADLRTSRLVIRDVDPSDEAVVTAYRNDPAVSRFQGWELPFTAQSFQQLLTSADHPSENGWHTRVITDSAGICGDIGLRVDDGQAEVGISLATASQGRGYAAEAVRAICGEAFEKRQLHRLFAGVSPENAAVNRLFTGLGWRHEGTSLLSYRHRGVWADGATYALLAQEWRARPS